LFKNQVIMNQQAKLLDIVKNKIRLEHYYIRAEEAYVFWIKLYIYFHNKRHSKDMGMDRKKNN